MSGQPTAQELEAPQPASGRDHERRRNRRVGVSLQVCLRPLDFSDGSFEEVRTTLNASRSALYFFTKLDRYYKGMRLRITSPYGPFTGSGNWEDTGEIVRVHRKVDGFGVAVLLSSHRNLATADPLAQPPQRMNTGDLERRRDLRCSFIAPAELIDTRAGVRIQARTSDLSINGCYIDTLNPLPVGASVRLRIHKDNQLFDARASVSSQHPGSGMGLVFGELTPPQRAILETWLCESLVPPEPPPLTPLRPIKTVQPAGADESRTLRLIDTLVRKGVLTQSEATEILRDSDL